MRVTTVILRDCLREPRLILSTGMVCKICEGKGEEKPTFQVMQVGDKLMDLRWVAKFHKKGHEVTKAD